MTAEELIAALDAIRERQQRGSDIESDHKEADRLLLDYINDDRVRKAFERLTLWYV